jgi:hypothetical protein
MSPPRTLSIVFPDRPEEFWLTDKTFVVGDRLRRGGHTWIVIELGAEDRNGDHRSMTLRKDGASPDRESRHPAPQLPPDLVD